MSEEELGNLPGIGEAIAKKVIAFRETGRLERLEKHRATLGQGVMSIVRLPGLGAKLIRHLVLDLHLKDRADLMAWVDSPRAGDLTPSQHQALRTALSRPPVEEGLLWIEAASLFSEARQSLVGRGASEVIPAGPFARHHDVVSGLAVVAFGEPQATTPPGVRVTFVAKDADRGPAELFATSDSTHLAALVDRAASRGLSLSPDGLRRDREAVPCPDVDSVYGALGLPTVPPELREGTVALERPDDIAHLPAESDIAADLHTHTRASDGDATLRAMAETAMARGYRAMAVTDHSPAVAVAHGLTPDRLRAQRREARRLTVEFAPFRILWGAEVDILKDGSLDLPDDLLGEMDWVGASIHTYLDLDGDAQTRRLVKAARHPSVRVLSHPTARRLGRRPEIACRWDEVFGEAAKHGVAIEIDGSPGRMDVSAPLAKAALASGCRLTVSSDAHAPAEMAFVALGVAQARRAFARRDDVLNASDLAGLLSR